MSVLVADKYGKIQEAYEAASNSLPDLAFNYSSQGSADSDLLPELATIRARTRQLERNSGIAASAPQTQIDHVLGPVFKLSARPNYQALGRSREWAIELAERIEVLWNAFSRSLFFDSQEQLNFTGMAGQVLRGRFSNGGHVVLPLWRRRPGVRYATCFQSVEIDRLESPPGKVYGPRHRDGIDFDEYGAPSAYHFRNTHPGDWYWGAVDSGYTRVPAKTAWGRKRVLHCFQPTRAGQSKGSPALTAVLREFKSLDRYRQAELNRAVAHALTTFFIKSDVPDEFLHQIFDSGGGDYLAARNAAGASVAQKLRQAQMGENMIVGLNPGDDIVNPRFNSPNDQMPAFMETILRDIAAGLGMSYELLRRDYSRTNYSSARAALLQDWKTFAGQREWLATYYARPVYTLWFEEAVNNGDIDAPDFYENIDAYTECSWSGAPRGSVDPVKESTARRLNLDAGTTTLEEDGSEQGQEWRDRQFQRALEIRNAVYLVRDMKLPEQSIYVLAGMSPPKSDLLASAIDQSAGLLSDNEAR